MCECGRAGVRCVRVVIQSAWVWVSYVYVWGRGMCNGEKINFSDRANDSISGNNSRGLPSSSSPEMFQSFLIE